MTNVECRMTERATRNLRHSSLVIRHSSEDFNAPYALCGRPQLSTLNSPPLAGFTLLEVMIAMFVFFIVVFAVLGMVTQSLGAARALQHQQADCGMVASMLSLSNTLEESFDSGDFEGIVPDYRWERTITEVGSNGFFQVDIAVFKRNTRGKEVGETMSVLMYKPGGRRKL